MNDNTYTHPERKPALFVKRHRSLEARPEVASAIQALAGITGWPKWFAKNIVLWRAARGLSVGAARTVE
jgi:hypothetical protein